MLSEDDKVLTVSQWHGQKSSLYSRRKDNYRRRAEIESRESWAGSNKQFTQSCPRRTLILSGGLSDTDKLVSRPPSRSPPRTLADTKLSAADFDSVRRFVSASLSAGLCPLVSAADMTWRTVRRCSPREVRRCSPQTSIWRTPADVHRCPADSESVRGVLSAVGTAI